MTVASTIEIKLDAQTAALKKGFSEATSATKGLQSQMRASLGNGILKFNAALQVTQTALRAISGLIDSVMESINRTATLGDFANRINVSAEALQRMGRVTEQLGGSSNVLQTAMQRMSRRIADAAANGGPLADRLERAGLSVQKLSGMNAVDQFYAMADAVAEMNNSGEQMAFVMANMDTEGVALVDTLRQGGDALREMAAAIDDNTILSDKQIAQNQAAAAAVKRMDAAYTGMKDTLIASVAPALEKIFSFTSEYLIPAFGKLIDLLKRYPFLTGAGLILRGLDSVESDVVAPIVKANEEVERIAKATEKSTEKVKKDVKAVAKSAAAFQSTRGAGAVTSTSAAGFSAFQSGKRYAEATYNYQREMTQVAVSQLRELRDLNANLEPVSVDL